MMASLRKTFDNSFVEKDCLQHPLYKRAKDKLLSTFLNMVDPKVLKYLTKSRKSSQKAWKKIYGFPYVRAISWDGTDTTTSWDGSFPVNATKCFKKCARYVSSYYKRYKV